jgi:hypothetical protein
MIPEMANKDKYNWKMSTEDANGNTLLWGECGVKLSDNVFITLDAEAAFAIDHVMKGSSNYSRVDLKFLKVSISGRIGAYTGV